MAKDKVAVKIKSDAFYTRAKSLRLLTAGADPQETFTDSKGQRQSRYLGHPNSHVRVRAFVIMGHPLPENIDDQNKFLLTLIGDGNLNTTKLTPEFVAALRLKFLKEVPPVQEPALEEVVP